MRLYYFSQTNEGKSYPKYIWTSKTKIILSTITDTPFNYSPFFSSRLACNLCTTLVPRTPTFILLILKTTGLCLDFPSIFRALESGSSPCFSFFFCHCLTLNALNAVVSNILSFFVFVFSQRCMCSAYYYILTRNRKTHPCLLIV